MGAHKCTVCEDTGRSVLLYVVLHLLDQIIGDDDNVLPGGLAMCEKLCLQVLQRCSAVSC